VAAGRLKGNGPDIPLLVQHHRCMAVQARIRGSWRWSRPVAWSLAAASTVSVGVAVVASVLSGLGLSEAVSGFVVTNVAMALSFSLCGLLVAVSRPANPIGWLFLAAGLAHAVTAVASPLVVIGSTADWPLWVSRAIATVGIYSWPWSISLFLPLALLLFPNGRPPGRQWHWLVWVATATAPLFVVAQGAVPTSLVPGGPLGYLTLSDYDSLAWVWTLGELSVLFLFAAGVAALVLRYRRGSEDERRQLLWLLLAALVTLGVLIPWSLLETGPELMLLAIPLIGGAVTIAILRHQLLDIRFVFSRAVLYLLLLGGVALTYVVLAALLELMLRRQIGLGASVLATVVIAVGFHPVRARLQRLLDRTPHGRMPPADNASRSSVRPVLTRFGLPAELIEEAERYNVRYQLRELGVLLIFGVVINSLIAGGLLRLSFAYLDDEQPWLLVLWTVLSSVLAVLVTSTLLRALIRRNMPTYTVHLLFRVIAGLSRTQRLKRPQVQLRHRRRTAGLLRATRQDLRTNSWILTGNLAILSGRRLNERDWPRTALLGRWLCWAGEDIDNTDRVEGALQACVDTLRHVVRPESLGPPPLRHPPDQARIVSPPRTDWRRYGTAAQAALISSIPLITTSVGLVTKLTQ
jgi:hypothetical protein